jgi:hypothetical protein
MTRAIVVSRPEVCALPKIKDPMNKTIHMAIRKEQRRKAAALAEATEKVRQADEARVASGRFGSIKGLDKLKVG